MKLHPSLTLERIESAVRRHMSTLDDPGFCIACGTDADGVEPDAQRYRCDACCELAVYGAEDLLIRIAF